MIGVQHPLGTFLDASSGGEPATGDDIGGPGSFVGLIIVFVVGLAKLKEVD